MIVCDLTLPVLALPAGTGESISHNRAILEPARLSHELTDQDCEDIVMHANGLWILMKYVRFAGVV